MSTSHVSPNNRASLLAGLRTGGVRSVSVPHTAAPSGSFNVSPFSQPLPAYAFPEDDEPDQVFEMPQRLVYNNRNFSVTAAVDGPNNRFAAQQASSRGMNPLSVPFNPPQVSSTHLQLQMMQLEVMRLQALQAQQLQTEILAQQIQQQQAAIQARERRTSLAFNPPATAGPMSNTFNVANGSMRRPSQADFLRAQLGVGNHPTDQVPMTAAIGGRFGTRSTSLNVQSSIQMDQPATPNPASTMIISGGTSLGNASPNSVHTAAAPTPSKSDAASSWRRGGNNNSVLTPNRVVSPASKLGQRSSPPAIDTSPNTHLGVKFRPQPLRFNAAVSQPLPTVAIDTTDDETDETHSSGSSVKSTGSKSSPTTPRSTASHEMPLSPREEASKKLFEGLGISRPVSATPSNQGQQAPAIPFISTTPAPGHRLVSQPTRQPRGPPSGADELGPKNFATRMRRKAIGGLGMLMGARGREAVEAY